MDPIELLIPFIRPVMRRSITRKRALFDQLPPSSGRVVFLGDSITEGGVWDEWFPELPCLRRGSAATPWAASGALRKEFTRDHLHLTVPGYRAWVGVLRPHLARFSSALRP